MAAVDLIKRSDLGPGLGEWGEALDGVKERVLEQVKRLGWAWYYNNEDRVLVSKKFWFFTLALRVRDLTFVFEELFGEEPDRV